MIAASSKDIKVLLVEDNPADARFLRESLRESSSTRFEVVHADRLGAALDKLSAERFDIVLLDLGLPDSQGLETFTRTHENSPASPIVVLTGLDDEALATKAVQAGAQDYLVKGQVEKHLLIRALRYAIERVRRNHADALRKSQTMHLWRSLFHTLGRGASAVLYRGGLEAGSSTYNFVAQTWKPRSDGEFLRALGEYLRSAGLCNPQSIEINRESQRMIVSVVGNFEGNQFETREKVPSCHFLRGILRGVGSKLLRMEDLVCDEVACEAAGEETCEFVVHPMFT